MGRLLHLALWHRLKVYIDGRSDFYGRITATLRHVSDLRQDGIVSWRPMHHARDGFAEKPLAQALRLRRSGKVVRADSVAVIFEKGRSLTVGCSGATYEYRFILLLTLALAGGGWTSPRGASQLVDLSDDGRGCGVELLQRGVAWTLDILTGLALGYGNPLPFLLLGGMACDVKMLGAAGSNCWRWALLNIFVYFGVLGGMVALAAAIAYSGSEPSSAHIQAGIAVGRARWSRPKNSSAARRCLRRSDCRRVLVVPLIDQKQYDARSGLDDVRHCVAVRSFDFLVRVHQATKLPTAM